MTYEIFDSLGRQIANDLTEEDANQYLNILIMTRETHDPNYYMREEATPLPQSPQRSRGKPHHSS